MGRASAEDPRRQWVRRTNIPVVETSLENFLLSMEYVCSQAILGSGSSCKWGAGRNRKRVSDWCVETQESFNEVFKMIKKVGGN